MPRCFEKNSEAIIQADEKGLKGGTVKRFREIEMDVNRMITSILNITYFKGCGFTPSLVMITGLIIPLSSNVIRSTQVTR